MLEKLFYKRADDMDSYSDAFESRVRDRFEAFREEAKGVGTSDENRQILYGLRMRVNGKDRRVTDIAEAFVTMTHINIRMLNTDAMPDLAKIIKEEKGLTNIQMKPEEQLMVITLPKPSLEQKLELNDYVENRLTNFKKNIMGVKAQTGQQLKAGLDKEFIQPADATKSGKNIEKVSEHYLTMARMLTLLKQKSILKGQFTFRNDDEKVLLRKAKPYEAILAAPQNEDEDDE